MYAIDFEYDGQRLSDYGFMICNFDYSDSIVELESGSNIVFNKVSHQGGQNFSLTSTQYDDCIETTFDICRIPEDYDYQDREISIEDFREIIRWLNRKEFLLFRFIEDNNEVFFEKPECYFNATFNVTKLTLNDKLYGMRLKMITNSPFGYAKQEIITLDFVNNNILTVEDKNDEIGYTYLDVTITCQNSGIVHLINTTTGKTTQINNCTQGEIITIKGVQQIITSSVDSHKIYNDFNFEFPKIQNTYNNRKNTFLCTNSCIITMSYRPIIKDVF